MEALVDLGRFLAGLGIFFAGIATLWWCSLYAKREKP